MTEGRCLCGAVQVRAESLASEISACFCEMCLRWNGGPQMGIAAPAESVTVTGPVRRFRASPFAERAWCENCGSALWLRDDGGDYEFVPGIFPGLAGAKLARIVYADRAPEGVDFAGNPQRVSAAEYEKTYPFVPEGDLP